MAVVDAIDQHGPAVAELMGISCRSSKVPCRDATGTLSRKIANRAFEEAVVERIEISRSKGEVEIVDRRDRAAQLEALDRLVARIVELEASAGEQEALEALERLVEQREVHAEARPRGLDAQFPHFGVFRPGEARTCRKVGDSQSGIADRRRGRKNQRTSRARDEIPESRAAVAR